MRNACLLVVSACLLVAPTFGEPPAQRQMLQAQPGSQYSVQLVVDDGLSGYPFECKITGDPLPKGMVFDCSRLQFHGRLPVGLEKAYNLDLHISDPHGHIKEVSITLLVSRKPILINVDAEHERHDEGNVEVKRSAPVNQPAEVPNADQQPGAKAEDGVHPGSVAQKNQEVSALGEGGPNAASTLQLAVMQLRPAPHAASSIIRHGQYSVSKAHPDKIRAYFTTDASCKVNGAYVIPDSGPVDDEQDAFDDLETIQDPTAAGTDAFKTALKNLLTDAPEASARLRACVETDADKDFKNARNWFAARADAWDALVRDMKTNGVVDSTGAFNTGSTYQPSAEIVAPLLDNGNPAPSNQPPYQTFGIVGTSLSAASSANPESKLAAELYGDAPLNQAKAFWAWAYTRIGSIAQSQSPISETAVASAVTAATGTSSQQLVQSAEFAAGTEMRLFPSPSWKTSISNQAVTLSFILGGGAITPLSLPPSQVSQAFFVTPDIYNYYSRYNHGQYADALSTICGTVTSATVSNTCYVAFYPLDRSRFFRHYEGSLRVKVPFNSSDPTFSSFPATIDATFGQNEYVTGGHLHDFVLHLGAISPIPYGSGMRVYAFGGMDFGVNGPGDTPSPLLLPTPTTATAVASPSNTVNIQLAQPNRDRYLLGLGWDIWGMIQQHLNTDQQKKNK